MSTYEGEHTIFGFWARLTSLRMMFSNSIHLPANDNISFFFMAKRKKKKTKIKISNSEKKKRKYKL
jgi:hypothetical protein